MSRIVLIVLALFVVWRLLSAVGRKNASSGLGADSYSRFNPRQRRRRLDLEDVQRQVAPEELSQCARCGVFVPQGRAVRGEGSDVFCSQECRDENRNERRVEA
jgi:hypothetical protein